MDLSDVIIILCRACEPGNVGAVCRAMKNMGLSRLRLAAQQPLDEEIIRNRAIHAADIWEQAQFFDTLAEAAADCTLLAGTTSRRGQHRKNISMPPRTLALWLKERSGPVGIVFGNERTGLETAELDLCNIASHIPVSDVFPSLNFSHAVQLYAYELFLALGGKNPPEGDAQGLAAGTGPRKVKGEWVAMNQEQTATLVSSITDTLADLGFYKIAGREQQARFLHDLISRAGLTEREGNYMKDIFAKAARLGNSLVK